MSDVEVKGLLALAQRLEAEALVALQKRSNPFDALALASRAQGIRDAVSRLTQGSH